MFTRAIAAVLVASCLAAAGCRARESFPTVVDGYLDEFARRHPSIAAGNGLHQHDDRLEDFSAPAIAAEVKALNGWRARLAVIDASTLPPDERVDHRILLGIIDGWLLDLTSVESWKRNPMIYASAITEGVHNLMVMESSPAADRAQRIIAKLQHVDALLSAARVNLVNPPALFVRRAIGMFRGGAAALRDDLPRAFASLEPGRLTPLLEAASRAAASVDAYANELESRVLPSATGSFVVGRENLEARYRAEELIDLPVDRLLAIGERELIATQAAFEQTAARIDPARSPREVWAAVLADHPARGEVVPAGQRAVDALIAFIHEKRLIEIPPHDPVVVAAAPEYDLGLGSMHSSPPLESTPVKSYYYITDARADWSPERQDAWLQKFNYATLSDITAHEVYPGHYAHSIFMRQTPGKVRRIWIGLNPFPQPSSGQDGWAHYGEQMILDEGFRVDVPTYRLAQLSEALTRICRLITGIRVHTGQWSTDDGARLFEMEAHLPAPAARQEAERASYDPTYGGYFLGKLAAFKLRRDVAAKEGASFDLRRFHERVMRNGIAPWWAHRQLLLPGDTGPVLR